MKRTVAIAMSVIMIVATSITALADSVKVALLELICDQSFTESEVDQTAKIDLEFTYETEDGTATSVDAPHKYITLKSSNNAIVLNEVVVKSVSFGGETYDSSYYDKPEDIVDGIDTNPWPAYIDSDGKDISGGKFLVETYVDETRKTDFESVVLTATYTIPANTPSGEYTITATADATDYTEADYADVTADYTLVIAEKEPEVETYTVTFQDADGTVLSEQTVEAGAAAIAPENPVSSTAYTYFTGWDKDFSVITADTVVTAEYFTYMIRCSGAALEFESEIYIRFNMAANTGSAGLRNENVKEVGLLIWDEDSYNADDIDYDAAYANPLPEDEDYIPVPKFAKQMNDLVYARAYAILNDGTIVYGVDKSNTKEQSMIEYSVVTYAKNKLTSSYGDLLIAMLNYGAASQKYLSYNTDNLANSILTEEQKTVAVPTFDPVPTAGHLPEDAYTVTDTSMKSAALVMDEVLFIQFSGDISAAGTVSNVQLLTWNEADYSTAMAGDGLVLGTETLASETTYNSSNSRYYGESFGVAPNTYFDAMYARLCFIDSEGNVGYSNGFTYSPEYYAYSKRNSTDTNLVALTQALIAYGNAAVAAFG